MKEYHNFIGIDIGKFTFVVATHKKKQTKEYTNNYSGISKFMKDLNLHKDSLYILEATGGYEMQLLLTLCKHNIAVHRANTRNVKNFIKSFGNKNKTDALDAKALALYGFERCSRLDLFSPKSEQADTLYALVQRRNDLKQMIVAEKNRLQSPGINPIKESCQSVIDALSKQKDHIIAQIELLIKENSVLDSKKRILKSIPGIGDVVANELIALLPELGRVNRKQIASLVGLAPRANDSGKYSGYRSTGYGRSLVKPLLFLSAMAARNSNSELKTFYDNLISRGKKKMVALIALSRKIIVIANAKLRDFYAEETLMNT